MDKTSLTGRFKGYITAPRSIVVVLVLWALVAVTLTGCDLTLEQRLQAQQPPTEAGETGLTPTIAVEPDAGPIGTQVAVEGEGWQPGKRVLLYMLGGESVNYAAASATADEFGQFTVDLVISSRFEGQNVVNILAQAADGGVSAWAVFDVFNEGEELIPEVEQPTITPSPSPTPTQTGEASPTPTPTATPTSTPTTPPPGVPTSTPILIPQVTSSTDLNVRSGPGVNYPVIGLLRAGQAAEATGRSASGGWWQIRVPGDFGWVSARYVVEQNTGNLPIVYVSAPVAPTATPAPTSTQVPQSAITDWRGEYFPNVDLSGAPVVRNDLSPTFNWGGGSPAPGIPADNFSARWTRSLYFYSGTYRFHAAADDGMRLWINDQILIDDWRDGGPQEIVVERYLDSGWYNLRLEFYERGGDAGVGLWWQQIDGRRDDDDDDDDDDDGDDNFDDWKGEYFDNRHLDGDPEFRRNDEEIDFDWGDDDVRSGMPEDNFSVRWSRRRDFDEGRYRLYARADDGIRVYINGNRVIDEWHDSDGDDVYTYDLDLDGSTRLVVEYYERTGDAEVEFWWSRIADQPTPTPTFTPTFTPTPTATPTTVPTATPVPDASAAVQAAINHLAAQAGVPAGDIAVVDVKLVEWTSTALGCPQPGQSYAPVQTSGFQVLLGIGSQGFDYRANQNASILISCQALPVEPQAPGTGQQSQPQQATATSAPPTAPAEDSAGSVEPSATPAPPVEPTSTPVPPTSTPVPPAPTATPVPPTPTPVPPAPTATPVPPTPTPVPPAPTATPVPPTPTPVPPAPTATPVPPAPTPVPPPPPVEPPQEPAPPARAPQSPTPTPPVEPPLEPPTEG